MNNLSDKIKQLRKSQKITQKQLADYLNISIINIQRFEYGSRRPSLDNLIALADYFNVSLDYLVGRTDNPEINK